MDRDPKQGTGINSRPAVLVTGGAGYIGAHCCRALVAAGYHPVVYDNFSTGHRSFVTGSLVSGDLADRPTLARTFAHYPIVAVMHFAAASLVGNPLPTRRNITSTTSRARCLC